MKNISDNIADTLLQSGILQDDNVDACRYGLDIFVSSVLEIISILVISVFVGNFVETLLFFLTFVPLRIYAGGYHADTKLKCYFVSIGVYAAFTAAIYALPQSLYTTVNILMSMFSVVIVFAAAPVVHRNKTVNEVERMYYRKFSILICMVETLINLILTAVFPRNIYVVSLVFGQVAVTVSMVAAIVQRKTVADK